MDWDNTTKRYGLACFESPNPPDIEAEGDACEFFDTLPQAQERAATLLKAGRFKRLVLWVAAGAYWEKQEDFHSEAAGDVG